MNNEPRAESRVWGWAVGLVAAIGVGLRVRALFANRSLWLDEAMLALNICGRTFGGLLAPLDYDQGAPIGFLMLERLAVVVMGPTELALRLVPFIASIAALALVYRFCRANFGIAAAAIGLALVALSPALISYSGEAKQYGVDVSVGLLLLTLAADALRIGLSGRRALILGAVGALAVWISHPAVFVLAGSGMTLMLDGVLKRRRAPVFVAAAISAFWLASFAATYLLSLKHLNANPTLNAMWETGFLSFPPKSLTDLRQYVVVVLGVFEAPYQNTQLEESLAGRMGLIAVTAFFAGILVLLRRDDRGLAALLVGPLAFAVLAAILHKYPLRYRLALFTTGPILLASATGLALLIRSEDRSARAVGRLLLVGLVLLPAMQAAKFLAESRPAYGRPNGAGTCRTRLASRRPLTHRRLFRPAIPLVPRVRSRARSRSHRADILGNTVG